MLLRSHMAAIAHDDLSSSGGGCHQHVRDTPCDGLDLLRESSISCRLFRVEYTERDCCLSLWCGIGIVSTTLIRRRQEGIETPRVKSRMNYSRGTSSCLRIYKHQTVPCNFIIMYLSRSRPETHAFIAVPFTGCAHSSCPCVDAETVSRLLARSSSQRFVFLPPKSRDH